MVFWLALCCAASAAVALTRFLRARIYCEFPWFTVYLALTIGQAVGVYWPTNSRFYGLWWLLTTPVVVAVRIALVLELWGILVRGYLGLRSVSSRIARTIVIIALVTSAISGVEFWMIGWHPTVYRILSLLIRFDASVLAVACGCLARFTSVFSHSVSRNVRNHTRLLTGYFTTLGVLTALIHLNNGNTWPFGVAMVGASVAFHLLWAVLMTRAGRFADPWMVPHPDTIEEIEERDRALYSEGTREL